MTLNDSAYLCMTLYDSVLGCTEKIQNSLWALAKIYVLWMYISMNISENQTLKQKTLAWPGIFNYTKDFPENTKEKSESLYFEDFYDLIIQKVIEFHTAMILSSWRFFWYPYWHIYAWHVSDAMYVNFVINVKNDIIDMHGHRLMSCINMSIWVSKEASETEDYSHMKFNNILND